MTTLRAFVALRPPRDLADVVASPPYDVVDTAEAAALADGNPDSFLRVSRPEIGASASATAEQVHRLGRAVLDDFVRRGVLIRDNVPGLLVYRLELGGAPHTTSPLVVAAPQAAAPAAGTPAEAAGTLFGLGGRAPVSQTGVVGLVSVADYQSGAIAVHEHTRPDKETDRTEHIAALGAHDEPVLLMFRSDAPGAAAVAAVLARVTAGEPEYTLDRNGVRHTLWTVDDARDVAALEAGFAAVPTLYVADGHHRCAAAARVAAADPRPGAAEFPAVVFDADKLTILGYHRVVRDLGEHTPASFLAALGEAFDVVPAPEMGAAPGPDRHQFGVYLDGTWRIATARPGVVDEADPIARLDVSVLQDRVLAPLLGIADPRTDARIAFIGGIRGTGELERLVDSGQFAVAFALHPTSAGEVMDIADGGAVMPPKSTWFEPKLLSGLFVHSIA